MSAANGTSFCQDVEEGNGMSESDSTSDFETLSFQNTPHDDSNPDFFLTRMYRKQKREAKKNDLVPKLVVHKKRALVRSNKQALSEIGSGMKSLGTLKYHINRHKPTLDQSRIPYQLT